MDKKQVGMLGERLAEKRYIEDGYKLEQRNFRTRFGEIDLVMQRRDMLVFIEVKTRRAGTPLRPAEAVDVWKQQKLVKAAQGYIAYKNLGDVPMRFDVAEVLLEANGGVQVQIIEDAFTL